MKQTKRTAFRRVLSMLLSMAMILSLVVVPVMATEESTDVSAQSESRNGFITVENVNYFVPGETMLLTRFWASQMAWQPIDDISGVSGHG